MPDSEQPQAAPKSTTYIIAAFAFVVVGLATYMNYGPGFHSHAAPAETVAPDTSAR